MKFKSEQTYDKLRGGFYTPAPVTNFLTRWAFAGGARSVLEPSCGDGAFLRSINAFAEQATIVHGVELDPQEAAKACEALAGRPGSEVFNEDFLKFARTADPYDAVVGNPPYIRYQFLSSETQELARELYRRHGLPFTKHLNAWAPFIVDSLDRLTPGGRIAMIIPAELLNVIHAGGLRLFLLQQCAEVLLIDPQELIFEDALQGTVLLMATKRRRDDTADCRLAIIREPDNSFLQRDPSTVFQAAPFSLKAPSPDKWMDSLLTLHEQDVLARVLALPEIRLFSDVANVSVGIVTGANKFFLVPDATVEAYDLHEFAKPMFGRSFHCRGVVYSEDVHSRNGAAGLATNFLHFGDVPFEDLPAGAQRYISEGEQEGLHERYKCRIRKPWYDVPSVRSSAISLLKRSHEAPRLIANVMGAYTTDTAYRVESDLAPEALAFGFFNSLTALSAEMRGRAYGGGVLELVPSEIRSLVVPVIDASSADLARLDAMFHDGFPVDKILDEQDATVLVRAGVSLEDIKVVQAARRRLMARRLREAEAA